MHSIAPPWFYTLSLHDALPIFAAAYGRRARSGRPQVEEKTKRKARNRGDCVRLGLCRHTRPPRNRSIEKCRTRVRRSEEHTSELQSLTNLVCRLLLEKKKKKNN